MTSPVYGPSTMVSATIVDGPYTGLVIPGGREHDPDDDCSADAVPVPGAGHRGLTEHARRGYAYHLGPAPVELGKRRQ